MADSTLNQTHDMINEVENVENVKSVETDDISEIVEIVENVENIESAAAQSPKAQSTETIKEELVMITELLDKKAKLPEVIAKVNELIAIISEQPKKARDRGPTSTREMTDDDARQVLLGDLKDESHSKAAEVLGLSYGQVYSARKGYTFKTIYKELRDSLK